MGATSVGKAFGGGGGPVRNLGGGALEGLSLGIGEFGDWLFAAESGVGFPGISMLRKPTNWVVIIYEK